MSNVGTGCMVDLMRAVAAVRFQTAAEAAELFQMDGRGVFLLRALGNVFSTLQGEVFEPQTLAFQVEDCERHAAQLSCASQACLASLRLIAEAMHLDSVGHAEAAQAALLRARGWLACMAEPAIPA